MPINTSFSEIFLRLAIIRDESGTATNPQPSGKLTVLVDSQGRLPVLAMGGTKKKIQKVLLKAVKQMTNGGVEEMTCKGLLAIEHDGREKGESDGLCHTFHLKISTQPGCEPCVGFKWEELERTVDEQMRARKLCPVVHFL